MLIYLSSNSNAEDNNSKRYSSDEGVLAIMYHRFNESKYPSTNIQMDIFRKHIDLIKKSQFSFYNPSEFEKDFNKPKKIKRILLTIDDAFTSFNRGSHMGYLRAHIGRVVTDTNGVEGMSIVIHSTVPGATGRNFCVWLDNSKGQAEYKPQYLIGHGGRFRNYWCQPDEVTGENMHPAPMPINRFGRPFAPITTLKEHLPPENPSDPFINNLNLGADGIVGPGILADANIELVSGRNSNTLLNESFETKSPSSTLVDGLSFERLQDANFTHRFKINNDLKIFNETNRQNELLNFENNKNNLFSLVKNEDLFNLLKKKLKKIKF